jgi:ERCC4-related helicase
MARSYQRRIFETAKKTNTIAVLRTGAGKVIKIIKI